MCNAPLRRIAGFLCIVAAAALSTPAEAQFLGWPMTPPGPMTFGMTAPPGTPMAPHGPGAAGPRSALKLSAEQQAQMAAVVSEALAAAAELARQIGGQWLQLRSLLAQDTLDPKAIGATYAKIFDYQRRGIEAAAVQYNKQMKVLTPQQREWWLAMRRHLMGASRPGPVAPPRP